MSHPVKTQLANFSLLPLPTTKTEKSYLFTLIRPIIAIFSDFNLETAGRHRN
ncbi:hypothetical protein ACTXLD_06210 [Psychrobacter faecalis]